MKLITQGTAANFNVGTAANNVVQLDGSAKIPAVDGSQLTNLPSGGFAAGTVMIFKQTAAPTGWTKDTTAALNDSALRVITGTVGAQAGTAAFSTTFVSRTPAGSITVDNHTLTTAEIPGHTHALEIRDAGAAGSIVENATDSAGNMLDTTSINNGASPPSFTSTVNARGASTGDGGAHNHTGSFTGTAMDFAVKYNDVIVASKD